MLQMSTQQIKPLTKPAQCYSKLSDLDPYLLPYDYDPVVPRKELERCLND